MNKILKCIGTRFALFCALSIFSGLPICIAQTALVIHEQNLFYKSASGPMVHFDLNTQSVAQKLTTSYKPLFIDRSGTYLILQNDTSLNDRALDQSFRYYHIASRAFDYSKDRCVRNMGYVREVSNGMLISISADQSVVCKPLDSIDNTMQKIISIDAIALKKSTGLSGDFSSNLISTSPDLEYFVSLNSTYKDVQLRKFSDAHYIKPIKGNSSFPAVKFTNDNRTLITGGKKLVRWDVATGKQLKTIPLDGGEIKSMVFSPDNKFLLYRTYESKIALVDLSTDETKWKITIEEGIRDINFHPDGKTFVVYTKKDTIQQKSVDSGK